jgi:hypothetical protein
MILAVVSQPVGLATVAVAATTVGSLFNGSPTLARRPKTAAAINVPRHIITYLFNFCVK